MAYYFHWPHGEVMNLNHKERIKFCNEISKINKKMNGDSNSKSKNIFDA
ncbi:MAG: hypothetical protein LBR79_04135 [Oscillospiraceae bacterium]|nr:hypothetical protein [Oscillospiraceae bacterium]